MSNRIGMRWKLGDIILDLYKVTDILGEGGFGEVYKVRHQSWSIDLAVKSPRPETVAAAGGVENFEREAETWVNLGLYPHIVSCYYVRRVDNTPLVFAEYMAGGSLHDWISNRRLYEGGARASLKRILDFAIQFAWGLHHAHEQGLIHQDVKPANAMLTPEGVVKVTDFGLAHAQVPSEIITSSELGGVSIEEHTLITAGSGGMTQGYCSPEQARQETLTKRTDLWSWGLSVLEMFQGERTWKSGILAAQALESYLQTASVESVGTVEMPTPVAQLLQRCFQENQEHRPRNLQLVAQELQQIYQQLLGEAYPRREPNLAKDTADSLNNRAVSLLDLGREDEALQLWEIALSSEPQHPESTYNRGLIEWRKGNSSDDRILLRELEASRAHTKDWKIDYLLSLVHLERDDCPQAIKILEAIQGEGTEFEEVKAALKLATGRLSNSKRLVPSFQSKIYCDTNSVCLSLDGSYILSGGNDKTLKLWEVATGKCLHSFEGHADAVQSVCLSPDERYALSGSRDQTLKLWEVATGKCLHTFEGHGDFVQAVCFSPDGRYAFSGSDDQTMKLWEIATGNCLHTFKGYRGRVSSISMSANGRYVLSGGPKDPMKLWEVATGLAVQTFEGDTDYVTSVCLSSDGRYVLSGDQSLKLWEVATGKCLRTFEGHKHWVKSVCLSPDGCYALSGGDDKTIKLWEVATGRCLRTFEGHRFWIKSLYLTPDARYALSGDSEMIKLWRVNGTSKPYLAPLTLSRVLATETIISIDLIYERELAQARVAQEQGNIIAAANHIRKARAQPGYSRNPEAVSAWTSLYACLPRQAFNGGWECATWEGHKNFVYSICMSKDGRYALSAGKTLKMWKVAKGRCLATFNTNTGYVTSLCMNQDGNYALSGSTDKTLKLWEVDTGLAVRTFKGHKDCVYSVCFNPNDRYALSGSRDQTLKLWEVSTGRCLRTFKGHRDWVNSVCISPNGLYALSGSTDKTLKLWQLAIGCCLDTFRGHKGRVYSVCYSPDGRYALSGSDDRTLKLWEIATGDCLRTFEGHTGYVSSVCFSGDGCYALSGSDDQTIKLWEVATGKCLRTFEGHTATVQEVCFSPDGTYALSGSTDKTCKLWVLDWELEDRASADWDEGARVYLETFLSLHKPALATLPDNREPDQAEVTSALSRQGTPSWTEVDFNNLMYTLSCAGYGWLQHSRVRQQLQAMIHTQAPTRFEQQGEGETQIEQLQEISEVRPNSPLFSVNPNPPQELAKVILTVTAGSLKGQEFEFSDRTTCIIGRANDCYLQLPNDEHHKTISRYHCLLDISPPAIRVRDLGSLHGTYVNGKIIGQRQSFQTPEEGAQIHFPEYDLSQGDEIKLGKTVFRVNIEGDNFEEATPNSFIERPVEATAILEKNNNSPSPQSILGNSSSYIDSPAPTPLFHSGASTIQEAAVQERAADPGFPSFEGYTTLQLLGKGGGGQVYLACNNQTQELVAIKVMLPRMAVNQHAIEMFLREVENTKALQHINVVQLLDYGYSGGRFFFTMEYCEGGNVADLMNQRGGRLSIDEAVPIILQALDGLEYAHKAEIPYVKLANATFGKGRGLVHRDFKPSNIFLTNVHGSRLVKVADYGLAKSFDQAGLSGLSMSGKMSGTPLFMPRQQAINFKYAKPEVDVWAAAASLYNMLTGEYPRDFTGKEPFLVLLQTDAVPIRRRDASIPKELAELIDLALVDKPQIHFKNAVAFKRALESVV
ncbi:MAG: protein kinase [Symploca sp. SIO2B6]|nr:protein kinase [Symploca sp. SIO2B6]